MAVDSLSLFPELLADDAVRLSERIDNQIALLIEKKNQYVYIETLERCRSKEEQTIHAD